MNITNKHYELIHARLEIILSDFVSITRRIDTRETTNYIHLKNELLDIELRIEAMIRLVNELGK